MKDECGGYDICFHTTGIFSNNDCSLAYFCFVKKKKRKKQDIKNIISLSLNLRNDWSPSMGFLNFKAHASQQRQTSGWLIQ